MPGVSSAHAFEYTCAKNDIEHRTTKPKHPWTNGQVKRMNRTIKDITVKRYYYESHDQLRQHLADFVAAYNFGRRLKTLKGLTPYEFICKQWTKEPERFKLDPTHQMPGLNNVENDHFRAAISLPLWLTIDVPIELNFSIWDSIDRESVGISGRTIEVEEEVDVRATFTLDVYDAGTKNEAVDCEDGDIDVSYHEIDLGKVDIFDHDDYDYDDRE